MPLDKSGSKASVGNNIRTEMGVGKPRSQAIAIALDVARRAKRDAGGAASSTPWYTRHESENMLRGPTIGGGMNKGVSPLVTKGNLAAATPLGQALANSPKVGIPKTNFPKLPKPPQITKPPKLTMKDGGEAVGRDKTLPPGPLLDSTPGRADKINARVEDGAYVLPADCISACGQGSSLAGHAIIERMIANLPRVKSKTQKAKGGVTSSESPVPVALSGGEHLLSRDTVERIGGGDYEKGRRILDHFVMHVRHLNVESLKKLPPPADD